MTESPYQIERDGFTISTDESRLDIDVIHAFLSRSYWIAGVPKDLVAKAAQHSLNFGLYRGARQVGYARVVTDYVGYGYLCDVFVLPEQRGKGLGKWLVESVLNCPLLSGLRTIGLGTRDAQGLYARFGFTHPEDPSRLMTFRRDMPWFRPDMVED